MDHRAFALILAFFLLFGCMKTGVRCSSNSDCSSGLFCVGGVCSSLECRGQGESCKSVWECCGSMECIDSQCQGVPELDKKVKVSLPADSEAQIYGAFLQVGAIDNSFNPDCSISSSSASFDIGYEGKHASGTLSNGASLKAGGTSITVESFTSKATNEDSCDITNAEAVLELSQKAMFEDILRINSTSTIPGTGTRLTLLSLTPEYCPDLPWKTYSASEGQEIAGQIAVLSVYGILDGSCSVVEKKATLAYRGTRLTLGEGQAGYVGGKIAYAESIRFPTQAGPGECLAGIKKGGKLHLKVSEVPCRHNRSAEIKVLHNNQSFVIEVRNDRPTIFQGSEISMDGISAQGGSLGCMGPETLVTYNLSRSEELRLGESAPRKALGDYHISLDSLRVDATGSPCKVEAARAEVRIMDMNSPEKSGTISLPLGEEKQLGPLAVLLTAVEGKFKQGGSGCAAINQDVSLTFESPVGIGGIFGARVPKGKILFIEHSITQDEAVVSGECKGKQLYSPGYAFNKATKTLSETGPMPDGAVFAYGVHMRLTGNSNGFSKTLHFSSVPFVHSGVEVRGANKAGDASIFYRNREIVLGLEESSTFEHTTRETTDGCTLDIVTRETITNHGFVETG